jgi:hypothetical protein
MTKVLSDLPTVFAQKQSTASLDIARRFEWRLQWEKSHLQDWQSFQQDSTQANNIDGSPNSEQVTQNLIGSFDETQSIQNVKSTIYKLDLKEINQDRTFRNQHIKLMSTIINNNTTNMNFVTTTPPQSNDLHLKVNIQKGLQYSRLLNQSKYQSQNNLHIYQSEGRVEVAFRSAGISNKEGLNILLGLRKDLASLGLKLTRLSLNGELFWGSETPTETDRVYSSSDESQLKKIY